MQEVSLHEITKSFQHTRAVDQVSITFRAGEIHAILGENGAGKSTLMHVLSGLYRPDAGAILIDKRPQTFPSPRAALVAGIAMVHQHFMLVPSLTAAENIYLALPRNVPALVRRPLLSRQVRQLADRYRIDIGPPDAPVSTLSVGAQQRVEILKALASEARCLILDEPTAVLTPAEVEELFFTLQRLRQGGYLIILITHKIPEVLALSDQLSVLRRGRLVTTLPTAACTGEQLAQLMMGDTPLPPPKRLTPQTSPPETGHRPPPLLVFENVWSRHQRGRVTLCGVSFVLQAGEVIGVAGVDGNGQTELIELLIGLQTPTRGTVRLAGQPPATYTPAALRIARVALIPQDRRREGLALSFTIAENLLLNIACLASVTPGALLTPRAVRRFAERQIARFSITPPSPAQPVATLSGGNQQRVVIARELAHEPQVIIAAHPSRGLDISATRYVHSALLACCDRGAGMILISTDLDEVLALSDHIYTLYQGRLLGPVEPTAGRERIGRMMTGTWVSS
jgi:simple sugar transport system ATP-binding protein